LIDYILIAFQKGLKLLTRQTNVFITIGLFFLLAGIGFQNYNMSVAIQVLAFWIANACYFMSIFHPIKNHVLRGMDKVFLTYPGSLSY
jgi:hypothetical protein